MLARMFSFFAMGLLAASMVAAADPGTAESKSFEGKVVAAAEKSLTLDYENAQHNFVINEQTKITLDGNAATWADLKEGFEAKVSAVKEGDAFVAREIAASSSTD